MNINTGPLLTLTAAGAGTYDSVDLPNLEWRGGSFGVNLGTVTSASVVVTIQGKDIASGQYYTLLTGAALTAAGFSLMQVAPGLVSTSNAADAVLPATYRISVTITGAGAAVTGTIGGSLIL